MRIVGEVNERGVRETRFDLDVDDRVVPGIVWEPAEGPARALVLIGHGYLADKRAPYILSLARRLVRHHGIAAVAIDAPEHGDRTRGDGNWWTDARTDETITDWKATLAAARERESIGRDVPMGYWGFSMGTIFGLPFVAAEPSVSVAVLGLMGVAGPTQDRIEACATSLRDDLPLLFVLQRDDELFALRAGMTLFDAFATRDKRLHLNLGSHSAVPLDEFEHTERFLATHLLA